MALAPLRQLSRCLNGRMGAALLLALVLPCSSAVADIKPVEPPPPDQARNAAKKAAPADAPRKAQPSPAKSTNQPKSHLPAVAVGDTAVYQMTDLKTGKKSSYTSVVTSVTTLV